MDLATNYLQLNIEELDLIVSQMKTQIIELANHTYYMDNLMNCIQSGTTIE